MARTAEAKRSKASDASKAKNREMSDDHKAKLAEGREQARVVGRYLEVVRTHKPKRGRKVTADSLQSRLERIESELIDPDTSAVEQLQLLQDKKDILRRLEEMQGAPETDLKSLEAAFIKVGKDYADRKGIAKSTFRDFGVPPEVLKSAGI